MITGGLDESCFVRLNNFVETLTAIFCAMCGPLCFETEKLTDKIDDIFLIMQTLLNLNYLRFRFGGIQKSGIGFIIDSRFLVVDISCSLRTVVKNFLGTPSIPIPISNSSNICSGAE